MKISPGSPRDPPGGFKFLWMMYDVMMMHTKNVINKNENNNKKKKKNKKRKKRRKSKKEAIINS